MEIGVGEEDIGGDDPIGWGGVATRRREGLGRSWRGFGEQSGWGVEEKAGLEKHLDLPVEGVVS